MHLIILLQTRFKLLSVLLIYSFASLCLLMLRIKITGSFFFLFLVWNLFLAVIPYVITTYLFAKKEVSKLKFLLWLFLWLLFLPNAPYIVTDLIHLKIENPFWGWFDVLLLLSFALNGLVLYFLSILDMEQIIRKKFHLKSTLNIVVFISILTAFGVYIGRFLRFNSWDILQNPQLLFQNIFSILISPKSHFEAWAFTVCFSLFLVLGYWIFKMLRKV